MWYKSQLFRLAISQSIIVPMSMPYMTIDETSMFRDDTMDPTFKVLKSPANCWQAHIQIQNSVQMKSEYFTHVNGSFDDTATTPTFPVIDRAIATVC